MRRTAVASLVLSGLFIAGCGAPQSLPFSSQDGISTPMSAEPAAVSSDAGSSCSESSCPIPGNTWSGGEKKPLKPAMHCPGNGDMVLVDVDWCPNPLFDRPQYDETGVGDPMCAEWMPGDKPCDKGGTHPSCVFARCKRYKPEATVCPVSKQHRRFCMDKLEYTKPSERLPLTMINLFQATDIAKSLGKRLCKESEWEAGCETSDNLPYGVVNGLERPHGICNIDVMKDLGGPGGRMRKDLLVPSGSLKDCHNSLGLYDLDGNEDEITVRDRSPYPTHSKEIGEHSLALKGGHYAPIRARCRPSTTAHSSGYCNTVSGVRFRADVIE